MTTPSQQEYIRDLIAQRERSFQTAFAAKVIDFNATDSTCIVEPQFIETWRNRDGERETETIAAPEDAYIENVPVVFPRFGSLYMCGPLEGGEFGLVVCTKYSLNQWRDAAAATDPGDLRRFTMDGAVFFPVNLFPDAEAVDASEGATDIYIGSGGTGDYVALKKDVDDIKSMLDDIKAKFNSHTHGGVTAGGGSTGPVSSASTASYTPTCSKNFKVEKN